MKDSSFRLPPFDVNRNVRRTLVDQITEGIRRAIKTGYYRPGDRLPPMRVFEETFGVSRIVTNAVMANLAAEDGSQVVEWGSQGHLYRIHNNVSVAVSSSLNGS